MDRIQKEQPAGSGERMRARRLLADSLAICPVCEAVLAREDSSCFGCGWHGEFVRDLDAVGHSLARLEAFCPELLDAMLYEVEGRGSPR